MSRTKIPSTCPPGGKGISSMAIRRRQPVVRASDPHLPPIFMLSSKPAGHVPGSGSDAVSLLSVAKVVQLLPLVLILSRNLRSGGRASGERNDNERTTVKYVLFDAYFPFSCLLSCRKKSPRRTAGLRQHHCIIYFAYRLFCCSVVEISESAFTALRCRRIPFRRRRRVLQVPYVHLPFSSREAE